MPIHFTKMHGLGNDFVVIDGVRQIFHPDSQLICQWANRRTGIGFDQLLLVEKARNKQADFFYRIFNADGSEVAQCGNGARCLARFLHDENLTQKNPITVETIAGSLELSLEVDEQITVNMGTPILEPKKIPFITEKQAVSYALSIDQKPIEFCAISMGNPHCVIQVDDVNTAPVQTLGALLSKHPSFPEETNVGFMQIIDPHHVKLRVYERGAAETLACGSGACAAVVAGRLKNLLDEKVSVDLPGGRLKISWKKNKMPVYLAGPAVSVFKGIIDD